jgi:hypothetical protein
MTNTTSSSPTSAGMPVRLRLRCIPEYYSRGQEFTTLSSAGTDRWTSRSALVRSAFRLP